MKQIPAGQFKTHCLSLMDEVQATGKPVLVTKHGKPVIKIVPARQAEDNIFGYMADKAKVVGDILAPITKDQDWDALK